MADRPRQPDSGTSLAKILVYAALLILWGSLLSGGLLLALSGALFQRQGLAIEPANMIMSIMPRLGLSLALVAVLGLVLLLPPVRRALEKILDLRAGRVTHTVALAYAVLVLANLALTLSIGLDNLADWVTAAPTAPTTDLINITWLQELFFAIIALFGVGWLSQRDWRQAWRRLGVVRPSGKQLLLGIGVGLATAVGLLLLEAGLSSLGISLEGNEDVARLSEAIIGPLSKSWWGVITLGVAAALGEETVFRGALQPRFGLWLTAALFALLHSTYGLSLSTVAVFLVGLLLGLLRRRTNTSVSMAMHATYNMALGFISMAALWPQ